MVDTVIIQHLENIRLRLQELVDLAVEEPEIEEVVRRIYASGA